MKTEPDFFYSHLTWISLIYKDIVLLFFKKKKTNSWLDGKSALISREQGVQT